MLSTSQAESIWKLTHRKRDVYSILLPLKGSATILKNKDQIKCLAL